MNAYKNHVGVKSRAKLKSLSFLFSNPNPSVLKGLSYGEFASFLGVLKEIKE